MLTNYLLIVFRNIKKNKVYSSINILGLAFGIAVCTIIYLYVSYENSYDKFNTNADNIYRPENIRYYNGGADISAGCVALLGPTLKEEIPEVLDFTRLRKISMQVSANNYYFNEENVYWAVSSFLSMFSFPLISGKTAEVLAYKYSAVLTKETADKHFGSENAIGKTIHMDGMDFNITGIAENVPHNSHIKFDILRSFKAQLNDRFCWECNNNNTYIQVEPGIKELELESKLPLVIDKLHQRQKDGFSCAYLLRPLTSLHLHSNIRFEFQKNGSADTIYFLSIIAVMILLIAWINYINLSTLGLFGLSIFMIARKVKEIAIRKVVGASVFSLIILNLKEFIKWILIANIVAFPITYMVMNYWLQGFAYKSDIELPVFVLSGFIALMLAIVTLGFQILKAALANPVDSLKYE